MGKVRVMDVSVSARVVDTGERLQDMAREALGIWGGMHHSVRPDDDGLVSMGFDPATATGGVLGVINWLDSLDCDWTAKLSAWTD